MLHSVNSSYNVEYGKIKKIKLFLQQQNPTGFRIITKQNFSNFFGKCLIGQEVKWYRLSFTKIIL
jgi:hypothetical protein